MKAIMYTEYGAPEVLKLTDIAKPTPKDNEVLIKIHAVHVNFGDTLARKFNTITPSKFTMPFPFWLPARLTFGFRKPKVQILGSEFSGEIEAVGKDVTRYQVGDPIFAYRGAAMGANAEYICMPEDAMLAIKPANMSYEEIASVPYGALTALNLLSKANIQRGQKVLINGASGSIGLGALQLAKHYGAEVTGVCGTPRLDFVKSLGADHVIDYTQEDFTQNGEHYDLILDIMNKSSFAKCKNSLTENGIYMLASFKMKQVFQMLWTSRRDGKKVICALSMEKTDDILTIKELVESGEIKTLIDKCFPLEQTAQAHRYVESGQKRGNVVIKVADSHKVQAKQIASSEPLLIPTN